MQGSHSIFYYVIVVVVVSSPMISLLLAAIFCGVQDFQTFHVCRVQHPDHNHLSLTVAFREATTSPMVTAARLLNAAAPKGRFEIDHVLHLGKQPTQNVTPSLRDTPIGCFIARENRGNMCRGRNHPHWSSVGPLCFAPLPHLRTSTTTRLTSDQNHSKGDLLHAKK